MNKQAGLLLVCALQNELKVIKSSLKNISHDLQIDYLCSGVGSLESAINLTKALQSKKYSFVLNVGVCGYANEYKQSIQVGRSYHLSIQKECIVPTFFEFTEIVSIACSDTPVYEVSKLEGENFVDMESFAVEKVCEAFQLARIILKVPTDKIGEETHNYNKEQALRDLKEHIDYEALIRKIETYISKIPRKVDMSLYESCYPFTASEKIIFEKAIIKYQSLSSDSFEVFYKKHHTRSKKDFLKLLEEHNAKLSLLN